MLFGTKLTYCVAQSHDDDVVKERHVTQHLEERTNQKEGFSEGGVRNRKQPIKELCLARR